MQQDVEDRKNDIIIKGFEDKIKKLEDSLNEKDSLLRSAEDSLAEARSQNEKLRREQDKAQTTLEKKSDRFDRESKALNASVEAEIEKNVKLSETITNLCGRCFGISTQCIARLMSHPGFKGQSWVHLIHVPKKTTYIITECIETNVMNIINVLIT
jgi:predicted nuclease with TOPRIM domain